MIEYKIVLCGDYGVGKSSLVERLFNNCFIAPLESTIGAAFKAWEKKITIAGKTRKIRFGIWDTAGQERFAPLLPMYIRDAHAIIYCWPYDVPLDTAVADNMLDKLRDISENAHIFLAVTKIDCSTKRYTAGFEQYSTEQELAGVYFTSSKIGVGVQPLFDDIARQLANSVTPIKNPLLVETVPKSSRTKCCSKF